MPVFVLGLNHTTAPIEVRERLAYTEEGVTNALHSVQNACPIDGVAVVSTCNRTEFYFTGDDATQQSVYHWITQQTSPAIQPKHIYQHREHDAVLHLFRVACGLDSLVMGEPQITGQLKTAHQIAKDQHSLDAHLHKLFEMAFSVSKHVRSHTDIGTHPVSVASASVKLAKRIFSNLSDTRALLIGAGETISLVAQHLRKADVNHITIANRNVERGRSIAEEGEDIISIADIPLALESADIVISSTASTLPLLGKGMVETALKQRKHRPYFMIDLAVPRDIEPEVKDMDDVYLYSIDDLSFVIEDNKKTRLAAAESAQPMIAQKSDEYFTWKSSLTANNTIIHLRQHIEALSEESIKKALADLKQGKTPETVLSHLQHTFTNKLLHSPSVKLREAAEQNDTELINAANTLFDLDPT